MCPPREPKTIEQLIWEFIAKDLAWFEKTRQEEMDWLDWVGV